MKLVVHKRSKVTAPDFSKKNPIWPNLGKKGPKWPNNGVFGVLTKICPLMYTFFCWKWNTLLLSIILRKPHVQEKSGSWEKGQNEQKGQKWAGQLRESDPKRTCDNRSSIWFIIFQWNFQETFLKKVLRLMSLVTCSLILAWAAK